MGATLTDWKIRGKKGNFIGILLGYHNKVFFKTSPLYLGSTVGRYANRIKNGQFSIGKKVYQLSKNNNENHLHGGIQFFS